MMPDALLPAASDRTSKAIRIGVRHHHEMVDSRRWINRSTPTDYTEIKLPKTRSVLRRSDGLTKPEPVDGSRDCSSLPGGGGQEVGFRRQAANDISSSCQISVSAFVRSRIISGLWVGPSVKRSRSVPRRSGDRRVGKGCDRTW